MKPDIEADVTRNQMARLTLSLCHDAESLRSTDPNLAAAIMEEVFSIVQDFDFDPVDSLDLLPKPGDTPDAATPEAAKTTEFHDLRAQKESAKLQLKRLQRPRHTPDLPQIRHVRSVGTNAELRNLMGLLIANSSNLERQYGDRPREIIKKEGSIGSAICGVMIGFFLAAVVVETAAWMTIETRVEMVATDLIRTIKHHIDIS